MNRILEGLPGGVVSNRRCVDIWVGPGRARHQAPQHSEALGGGTRNAEPGEVCLQSTHTEARDR